MNTQKIILSLLIILNHFVVSLYNRVQIVRIVRSIFRFEKQRSKDFVEDVLLTRRRFHYLIEFILLLLHTILLTKPY